MGAVVSHAWRNLWRNTSRTAITLVAVTLATAILILAQALMEGLVHGAIRNAANLNVGETQVHAPGYLADRSLYASLRDPQRRLRSGGARDQVGGRALLGRRSHARAGDLRPRPPPRERGLCRRRAATGRRARQEARARARRQRGLGTGGGGAGGGRLARQRALHGGRHLERHRRERRPQRRHPPARRLRRTLRLGRGRPRGGPQ